MQTKVVVLMLLTAVFSTACVDDLPDVDIDIFFGDDPDKIEYCQYGELVYKVGESFPANDGCNTCVCEENGVVACTEMWCGEQCVYNDQSYLVGESFPAGDGCNTCTCRENGAVACTKMYCPAQCVYNDHVYMAGEEFPAIDGCNTCTCDRTGEVYCTDESCPRPKCQDGEEYFEPGCGLEEGMPAIEPGCYTPCEDNSSCDTGVCQLTDINPCICEPGMDCCAACGAHMWLCLPPTE
jgi:hypothetical protein